MVDGDFVLYKNEYLCQIVKCVGFCSAIVRFVAKPYMLIDKKWIGDDGLCLRVRLSSLSRYSIQDITCPKCMKKGTAIYIERDSRVGIIKDICAWGGDIYYAVEFPTRTRCSCNGMTKYGHGSYIGIHDDIKEVKL